MQLGDWAGDWRETSVAAFYQGFWCPLWNDTAISRGEGGQQSTRFSCFDAQPPVPFRQWLPHRHRPCAHTTLSDLLPANQTLFAVGDSVSGQHMKTLVCRLLMEAGPGGQVEFDARLWFSRIVNPKAVHYERREPSCVRISDAKRSSRRVCYVGCSPSCVVTIGAMASHRVAVPGDLLVINEGLLLPENRSVFHASVLAHEFASTTSTIGTAAASGVRMIWREQSPQTFGGAPDGSYAHQGQAASAYSSRGNGAGCGPLAQPFPRPAALRLLDHIRGSGMPIVPTFDVTHTQWDVYLASRTAWVRTKLDCTHFCEPSGVLEAWTDRLLCVAPPVRALDVSGGG